MKKKLVIFILLLCGTSLIAAEPADDVYWNGGSGLWMNADNWTDYPDLPDWIIPGWVGAEGWDWNKGVAIIADGETQITSSSMPDGRVEGIKISGSSGASLRVTSGSVTFNKVLVGNAVGESGTINQTGGNVTINSATSSFGNGGSATYNLSGGNLTMANNGYFGGSSLFKFNQTGGTFVANDSTQHFYVGNVAAGQGQFDISAGNFTASVKEFYLGNSGSGLMNVSGTANVSLTTNANQFYMGKSAGSTGTLNVQGGTVNINSTGPNGAIIGYGGNATLNQTAGSLNITAPRLYIGWGSGHSSTSTVNFNNGTINVSGGTTYPSYVHIGRDSIGTVGTLNMTGGTFNLTTGSIEGMALGYYWKSGATYSNNPRGIVNLSGGTMNINSPLNIGYSGVGQFNLSGSGVLNANSVSLSTNKANAAQASSLTISGGTFDIDTYVKTNMPGDVITILGSDATKIEMSRLDMATSSKLSVKLGNGGITLIKVIGTDTNPYNGANLAGTTFEVDTLLGFDAHPAVYNVLWSATTIDTTGMSFANLSSTPFTYQIVNAAAFGYTSGQLMQLVVPEPLTITLLSIGGLILARRK